MTILNLSQENWNNLANFIATSNNLALLTSITTAINSEEVLDTTAIVDELTVIDGVESENTITITLSDDIESQLLLLLAIDTRDNNFDFWEPEFVTKIRVMEIEVARLEAERVAAEEAEKQKAIDEQVTQTEEIII